jgi:beta-1,4-mannosyl-glycoprotein beta-1,4-N-acetylglucosaminyltransferase
MQSRLGAPPRAGRQAAGGLRNPENTAICGRADAGQEPNMRRRVFDCFLFYNELDVLEIRLRELGDIVDHFVIVESTVTFQGDPKPLHFQDNKSRFARWADKIIHVVVGDDPIKPYAHYNECWSREHHQRNQIARGLATAQPFDLVMVSDVDEVLRAEVLADVLARYRAGQVYVLQLALYHFSLNRREVGTVWFGPRLLERRRFRSGQATRRIKSRPSKRWAAFGLGGLGVRHRNWVHCGLFNQPIEIPDAGWHFSSIGGYENWRAKIDAYAHQEVKQGQAYQSADAFEAWMSKLSVEPIATMPRAARTEPRFRRLLAIADSGAPCAPSALDQK